MSSMPWLRVCDLNYDFLSSALATGQLLLGLQISVKHHQPQAAAPPLGFLSLGPHHPLLLHFFLSVYVSPT